jgi:hypothetical protein
MGLCDARSTAEVEQLALGETSLCTLRPEQLRDERITLSLSTAQLRALETG